MQENSRGVMLSGSTQARFIVHGSVLACSASGHAQHVCIGKGATKQCGVSPSPMPVSGIG
jgi:hypothetical protein